VPPLPSIPGFRVIKAPERAGHTEVSVRGRHHKMAHPERVPFSVPVHKGRDPAKGTLRGILGQAGSTEEESLALL
jgi:predicted RNA binding protein YcfA (HicA-like mRNA interferase family)